MVPETLLAAAACVAADWPSVSVEDDGLEELLQPASATAATVISDQTTLRMELEPQVWIESNEMPAYAHAADNRGGASENSPNMGCVKVNRAKNPYAYVCIY
ncbi:hypothetical protein GCM10011408_06960 [Dyella caseinilytica]|nr:hypothetical protein GCM10011408_06960 [Dyella caseinilytica]